nr:reverse transcriptase domain-containing protein [Tanacetum cinerariifolium]
MADQRTMAELLRAPTKGYAKAIVVPPILAEQFKLKHSLINMMTTDQFFGLKKGNPHDHIRWAARRWLEKEPPHLIHTWEDLVSKFINEFFPPSRTTNIRNEISNFQQRFDESFHEAWDRYKDLLRAYPHHGFTELHKLDTFYNALNPAGQDSLNAAAAGGNLLERSTQDVLTIIKNKSKCLAAGGNTLPEIRDNIQGYVLAAVVDYNQGNPDYRPPVRRMNEANMKAMQTQIDMVKNELRNEMKRSIQTSLSNQTNKIKNMMASLLQMNTASTSGSGSLPSNTVANPKGKLKAITTRSGLVIDGPTVPTLPQSINTDVDERIEENFTDPDLAEYTNKVPPHLVQKYKPPSQREFVVHQRDPRHPNIPYSSRMLKQKQQEKDEVQIHKFCELKCKALADLGASINLMPLSVWMKLGLPELIPTHITLELANRAICTPAGIAREVFVLVGKFTFPADFVIVDYASDPRVPLILGRPFLWTARALIDVHGEEMILRDDFLEDLFSSQPSGNPTFLPHPELTLPEVNNDIFDSEGCNVLSEKLLDLDFTKDLHPPLHDNPLSGSTTYFSNPLLEEFADELPPEYDDNLQFVIKSDLKEIEFLLYQDKDSILKDSIDQKDLANLADIFVDFVPEMFTDEYALDYSSPLIFDEYDDDFLEVESYVRNVYDDPFDSKGEKIKESKLLIDELDLPCDHHHPYEYDSLIS